MLPFPFLKTRDAVWSRLISESESLVVNNKNWFWLKCKTITPYQLWRRLGNQQVSQDGWALGTVCSQNHGQNFTEDLNQRDSCCFCSWTPDLGWSLLHWLHGHQTLDPGYWVHPHRNPKAALPLLPERTRHKPCFSEPLTRDSKSHCGVVWPGLS